MRRILLGVVAAGLMASAASAQLVLNPIGKAPAHRFEVGAAMLYSSMGVEFRGDIDRMMMGGYGAFGITDMIDAYGSLAYSFSSDYEGTDGSGVVLGGGARAKVYTWRQLTAHAYAFMNYWNEAYDGNVDVSGFELGAGAMASYPVLKDVTVYAGLELVPLSTVEADTRFGDFDADRDTIFTLRGGANYSIGRFWLRGELALGGEMGILGSGGVSF